MIKLNKVIIFVLLVVFCLNSIASDTSKINISVILKNINLQNALGIYILDSKADNNILDFRILSYPYFQTFYVNKNCNPSIKILVQGLNIISDTIYLNLTEKDEYDISVNIKNKEKKIDLPEVIITAKKNNNNDTISFSAQKYSTQSTFKTDDLISNIDGFKLDDDGKIYYNNKPISKVMINGDNLSGDNYTLITKNLNSKVLDKIQLIKNENNNRILSSLQKSTDVAINLVLKKLTPKINPNIDIGLTNNDRYSINLNVISLLKKIKVFSFFNTNTIAEKTLLIGEESTNTNDIAEKSSLSENILKSPENLFFLNSNKIVKPLLPPKYILNNKDYLKGVYLTFRLSKKSSLNAEIINTSNAFINNEISNETYTIPNLPLQFVTTNRSSKIKDLTNKFQLNFNYDNKSKFILQSNLNYRNNNNFSDFFDLTKGSFPDELNENSNQNKNEFTFANFITYKLNNKNALLISAKNYFSNTYENINGSSNRLNSFFNSSNNNFNLINQNVSSKFNKNVFSLNLIHTKKINYNSGISFEKFILNPNSSIYFQNELKQKSKDDLKLLQIATFLKSNINISRIFNLNVDGLLGFSKLQTQNFNSYFHNKLSYGLITKFQTKEKIKLALELSFIIRAYLPDIYSFNNLNYLSSVNQINYPSNLDNLIKENSISMSISKRDLIKGSFSLNTSFFYNPTAITSNFIFFNGLFQNRLEIVKNNYGNTTNLNLERYSFLFKSKLFFDIGGGYSSINQLQNNELQNMKVLTNSLTIKAITNFKKATNFEIQILYNKNILMQTNLNKSFSIMSYDFLLKSLSPVSKRIMIGNTFKFSKYKNSIPIYLQHLSMGYVAKKKNAKIELLIHNIWNYKYFSTFQNSFFNYRESKFELVPRYFLLKTSFQF